MSPSLFVAHQTATRTRVRLTDHKQRGTEVLLAVAEAVASLPGVEGAEPRPATGSIVIHHPERSGRESSSALRQLPFDWGEPPKPDLQPALSPLTTSMQEADGWLHANTGGRVDLHTLIVIMMLSLALSQAARGNVMAPATSLLWYALDLLLRQNFRPSQ